jgi:hypothetical protein
MWIKNEGYTSRLIEGPLRNNRFCREGSVENRDGLEQITDFLIRDVVLYKRNLKPE